MEEKDTAGGPTVNSFGGRFGAWTIYERGGISLLSPVSIVYTHTHTHRSN